MIVYRVFNNVYDFIIHQGRAILSESIWGRKGYRGYVMAKSSDVNRRGQELSINAINGHYVAQNVLWLHLKGTNWVSPRKKRVTTHFTAYMTK